MDLRILQVMAASTGGIARHVGLVAGALDGKDGLTVDIAGVRPPIPLPKSVIDVDIPGGLVGHHAARDRLRSVIRDGDYDIVHAHGLRAAVDSALAARTGPPVLATVHNLVRPDVSGRMKAVAYRRAETMTVRLCRAVFAVSKEIATTLERRSPSNAAKIEVLYLGIAKLAAPRRAREEVRSELDAPGPLVVTASRLSRQKALPVMLRAIAGLEDPVVLAIAGTGPEEQRLRDLAASLGLRDRVRWLGFREDVHELIAAADVFCLSSTWEGIPLAAQEAIQLGTPVVATRVGGLPELIVDGVSGRLVPPGDSNALGAALADVLHSADLRTSLAASARQHLDQHFSTARMLQRLESCYRELARAM